ncbi:MAG: cache domain-containing protein [Lachnospiraceae bacterium]|nr:cache domain-containing protein [Lachnospiraceae bacterium]
MIREISASSEETGRQEKETVAATSAQSMEALVSSYFISYAIAQSDISDNSFWNMADSVYMLALQVQQIMLSPEDYVRRSVLPPTAENAGEHSAQLLFSDVTAASDASLLEKTERLGNLQDQMVAVISTSSGMKDCFIALPDGACILCDASAEEHVDENGAPVYFDATQRPWYRMAVNHEMLTFSSVSSDYYTGTYEVNVAVPVYNRFGKLMAVCGASMSLDNIEALVENAHVGDNGFSCIVNDSGKILFSNRQEGTLGLSNKTDLRDNENSELSALITDALSGNVDFKMITVDDEELCITYAPLASVGWTQLMVVPKSVYLDGDSSSGNSIVVDGVCDGVDSIFAANTKYKIRVKLADARRGSAITTGYATYNTDAPSLHFASDDTAYPYVVRSASNEAILSNVNEDQTPAPTPEPAPAASSEDSSSTNWYHPTPATATATKGGETKVTDASGNPVTNAMVTVDVTDKN